MQAIVAARLTVTQGALNIEASASCEGSTLVEMYK